MAEPGQSAARQRDVLALRWLYATGLRRSEMVAARCGDLVRVEFEAPGGGMAAGWIQRPVGKGGHFREAPVPAEFVECLGTLLGAAGQASDPANADNAAVPLLFSQIGGALQPIAASLLYKQIKGLFACGAEWIAATDRAQAARLRQASAHWLRHSAASHAVNPRLGQV